MTKLEFDKKLCDIEKTFKRGIINNDEKERLTEEAKAKYCNRSDLTKNK